MQLSLLEPTLKSFGPMQLSLLGITLNRLWTLATVNTWDHFKQALRCRRFTSSDEVKEAMKYWIQDQ